MITKMKKYTFLVFHRDYEAFLEQLRSLGVVHITEKASGTAEDATLQSLLQQADRLRKRSLITRGFYCKQGLFTPEICFVIRL